MALTDAERKQAILDEVGDPSGTLVSKVDTQWAKYAPYEPVSPTLHDLYVTRGLLTIKLAALDSDVDFTVDGITAVKASQAAVSLNKRLATVEAQILKAETEELGASGAAIGTLATVTPETPPTVPLIRPYGPDATDPPYYPSPYYPERGRAVRRW